MVQQLPLYEKIRPTIGSPTLPSQVVIVNTWVSLISQQFVTDTAQSVQGYDSKHVEQLSYTSFH
jgi:hypothetical protein